MFHNNKPQIEQANYSVANQWHHGLGLTFAGVDIGDVLEYPVLTVLGIVWMNHWAKTAPPVEAPPSGSPVA